MGKGQRNKQTYAKIQICKRNDNHRRTSYKNDNIESKKTWGIEKNLREIGITRQIKQM